MPRAFYLGRTPIPKTVFQSTPVRLLLILSLVYLFILAISLLGASFKAAGGDFARTIFTATANPIAGLIIGILTTSIIQSSSTTTSLIVGLVASQTLSFEAAIPMVMGANIGTTITNTIVSLGSLGRGDEFKRAFAGATMHDFFNLCSVAVLLPLQVKFNIIGISARAVENLFEGFGGAKFASPLAAITKPVAEEILHLFGDSALLSAILAFVLIFLALRYIVKLLKAMVLARVERFFQRYIFRTPILGFLLGIALTVMVQSSSITTSLVVPLIAAGVITLSQVYTYMMGANIGTTVTAFLASFATGSPDAIAIAFAHLLFNIYGTAIFWPLMKIPIFLAEKLAILTEKSKIVPFVFIALVFFVIPGLILLLTR